MQSGKTKLVAKSWEWNSSHSYMRVYCGIANVQTRGNDPITKIIYFDKFEKDLSVNGMKNEHLFYVWWFNLDSKEQLLILAEYINTKENRTFEYQLNDN
jgi:hypothetical protein